MTDAAAHEILLASGRALAQVDDLGASLRMMLVAIAEAGDLGSAAIVVPDSTDGGLAIAATFGLDETATARLAENIGRPGHPIARTYASPTSSFDVLPMVPGGPALRSHVPLIVTSDGTDRVLGVLALAHDRPIGAETRQLVEASAQLAAVTIERHRPR